jgi:hypothetical protein
MSHNIHLIPIACATLLHNARGVVISIYLYFKSNIVLLVKTSPLLSTCVLVMVLYCYKTSLNL